MLSHIIRYVIVAWYKVHVTPSTVDLSGKVFGVENLFVVDGAALPGAAGAARRRRMVVGAPHPVGHPNTLWVTGA